jgi:hypothetical protein
MSHRRPDQGAAEPSLEITRIRSAIERLEAEISVPNPPQDVPSRAAALAKIAQLQRRIEELEAMQDRAV